MSTLRTHRRFVLAASVVALAGGWPPGQARAGFVLECEPAVSEVGDRTVAVFTETESCTWEMPDEARDVSFLLVGGGGSGGTSNENSVGGGGGGGVVHGTSLVVGGPLIIQVGAGGTISEACSPFGDEADGEDSVVIIDTDAATTITAYGGGHGAGCGENGQATEGGSGGGGHSDWVTVGGNGLGGTVEGAASGTMNFLGSQGGAGYNSGGVEAGGGGGGATEAGESGGSDGGGDGGEGFPSDITGATVVYGSGGGGSSAVGAGSGGTGAGSAFELILVTDLVSPYNGADGTGGGGGAIAGSTPGRGGSGIFVLSWSQTLPATGVNRLWLLGAGLACVIAAGSLIAVRHPRTAPR